MRKQSIDCESPAFEFAKIGVAIVPLFTKEQQALIEKFAKEWVYRLLSPWMEGKEASRPLEMYHIWCRELPEEHRAALASKHRYMYPDPKIRDTIINAPMREFLSMIGVTRWKVWDDGWGDVGFRLIRPAVGDGYPLCCKDWGKAKGVVSFWIPVIGRSSHETLLIARGSHLRDYPRKMIEGKFFAHEPRFAGELTDLDLFRPDLRVGEAIAYQARTLHSEDVTSSDITRLNLEIRFSPK
ncbi:MAG: hypothetical protein WCS01_10615 [bacterium]